MIAGSILKAIDHVNFHTFIFMVSLTEDFKRMTMKFLADKFFFFTLLMLLFFYSGYSQTISYSVANGHAHNDYEHNTPFIQAYDLGFGSIEADVILEGDTLFVGHNRKDIFEKPLYFERDYILPLFKALQLQKDTLRSVVLLIDLKTEALPTLKKVIEIIERYSLLTHTSAVQFVITGNQPPADSFDQYPSYIFFDGNINNPAHIQHLSRIAIFSDNFRKYSSWGGERKIPEDDKRKLSAVIEKVHSLNKKIRFWGCPDNLHTWQQFMKLQVDFINTDHISQLAEYFR